MEELNTLGKKFYHVLIHAGQVGAERLKKRSAVEKVHVVGAGSVVTAAYEQLRNAAENAEEHLLLKNAIRRYFRRLFLTQSAESVADCADELVTELTFAGYLVNDSVSENALSDINKLASSYHHVYMKIQADSAIQNAQGDTWVTGVLAVEIARLLDDSTTKDAYAQFAYEYFRGVINPDAIFSNVPQDFDAALFVAVQKMLLKADPAMIRSAFLKSYQASPDESTHYMQVNTQIDALLASTTVDKLAHYVNTEGAPMRIIGRMLDDQPEQFAQLMTHKSRFLAAFEGQVETEYASVNKRINRGIVKSVIFLVITKFLIGIAIEVPYDYLVHQTIRWLPLLVNLFFPPLYMLLLRLTLVLPPQSNTVRLSKQAEIMLYGESKRQLKRRSKQFGAMYNVLYMLFFVAVFGGVAWVLMTFLGFEWIHLVIFFVFLSGASFLGFRLSRMIRELESVDNQQNSVTLVRDFLYMPFVVVGRYISEKYSQVNIVAVVLDMVIELPLKTILRLIRQWSAFISTKKDQL